MHKVTKSNQAKFSKGDPTFGLQEYEDLLQNVEHFSKSFSEKASLDNYPKKIQNPIPQQLHDSADQTSNVNLSSIENTAPEEFEISTPLNDTTKDSVYTEERPSSGASSSVSSRPPSQSRSNAPTRTFTNTITTTKTELSYDNFEIEKLSAQIDKHSAQLKRAIMDDFLAAKRSLHEKQNDILENHQELVSVNLKKATEEIASNKETINTLTRLAKHQEIVVARLSYNRADKNAKLTDIKVLYRAFLKWRAYIKLKRKLKKMRQVAANHRNKHLIKICLAAWRMDTFAEKRKKLDYNWQNKMEHVTNNIISQYEAELAKLRQQLAMASGQIESFNGERVRMQQEMKKSFMRGVCALNLEAMSMFKPGPKGTQAFQYEQAEDQNGYEEEEPKIMNPRMTPIEPPTKMSTQPQQPAPRQVRPPMPVNSHHINIVENNVRPTNVPQPVITRHPPVSTPKSIMKPKSSVKFATNKIGYQ